MSDRKSILAKIKALLAKTTDNGATEAEMLSALSKAREFMDAHDLHESDLAFGGESVIKNVSAQKPRDPMPGWLASAVASFCECRVWKSGDGFTFFGLESDTVFAKWLLDMLAGFVRRQSVLHLASVPHYDARTRNLHRKSFEIGCCNRINERLKALAPKPVYAQSNGRSLVVSKQALVSAELAKLGMRLGSARRSRVSIDASSLNAGRAAGDSASFNRPVNGGGGVRAIGGY